MARVLAVVAGVLLLAFAAVTVLALEAPVNTPVVAEPAWDAPRTRELAVRACFDCHSNETVWPWYARIAPVSFAIQREVALGREELNFSEWGTGEQEGDGSSETILEGSMPPRAYLFLHPDARLSPDEQREFIAGLNATLGTEGGGEGGDGEGEKDDD